jgi:hypothetical protein
MSAFNNCIFLHTAWAKQLEALGSSFLQFIQEIYYISRLELRRKNRVNLQNVYNNLLADTT